MQRGPAPKGGGLAVAAPGKGLAGTIGLMPGACLSAGYSGFAGAGPAQPRRRDIPVVFLVDIRGIAQRHFTLP
jgi:hypothetical protein